MAAASLQRRVLRTVFVVDVVVGLPEELRLLLLLPSLAVHLVLRRLDGRDRALVRQAVLAHATVSLTLRMLIILRFRLTENAIKHLLVPRRLGLLRQLTLSFLLLPLL